MADSPETSQRKTELSARKRALLEQRLRGQGDGSLRAIPLLAVIDQRRPKFWRKIVMIEQQKREKLLPVVAGIFLAYFVVLGGSYFIGNLLQ